MVESKEGKPIESRWPYAGPGIEDDLFIRGKVPMTKSEVRAVTLAKLKLKPGLTFLDIGAGTGSVSIEGAVAGCKVTALERQSEGVALIQKNAEAFGQTIHVIHGLAPVDLPEDKIFDRVFIGGTGGKMEGIFQYLDKHLAGDGVLVANTVTIENTSKFLEAMKAYGYNNIEASQVQVSRSKAVGPLHMMVAENPITIISATKQKTKENKNG